MSESINQHYFDGLKKSLQSDKVTERRDAVKRFRDNIDLLANYLDRTTREQDPDSKLSPHTWPGFLKPLCEFVTKELKLIERKKASKASRGSKAPDSSASKLLRVYVEKAELRPRREKALHLLRRVSLLFEHIACILSETCESTEDGQESEIETDYNILLRSCLLTRPEYVQRLSIENYETLVLFYLRKVSESHLKPESLHRRFHVLSTLVKAFKRDVPQSFLRELFLEVLPKKSLIRNVRMDSRSCKLYLDLVNHILAEYGLNQKSLVRKYHQTVDALFWEASWRTNDPKIKEELVVYFRYQCAVQPKTADNASANGRAEIKKIVSFSVLEMDLNALGRAASGLIHLSSFHYHILALITDAIQGGLVGSIASSISNGSGGNDGEQAHDPSQRKKKRRKLNGVLSDVIWKAKDDSVWLALLCYIVRRCRDSLGESALVEILGMLVDKLQQHILFGNKDAETSSPFVHNDKSLVWILRALREVSTIYPSTPIEDPCIWSRVWEGLYPKLSFISTNNAALNEAFLLLGSLIRFKINLSPAPSSVVLDMPIFRDIEQKPIMKETLMSDEYMSAVKFLADALIYVEQDTDCHSRMLGKLTEASLSLALSELTFKQYDKENLILKLACLCVSACLRMDVCTIFDQRIPFDLDLFQNPTWWDKNSQVEIIEEKLKAMDTTSHSAIELKVTPVGEMQLCCRQAAPKATTASIRLCSKDEVQKSVSAVSSFLVLKTSESDHKLQEQMRRVGQRESSIHLKDEAFRLFSCLDLCLQFYYLIEMLSQKDSVDYITDEDRDLLSCSLKGGFQAMISLSDWDVQISSIAHAQIVLLPRWELLLEHVYNLQSSFGSTVVPVQGSSSRQGCRELRKEIDGIIEQLVSRCKKLLKNLSVARDPEGGATALDMGDDLDDSNLNSKESLDDFGKGYQSYDALLGHSIPTLCIDASGGSDITLLGAKVIHLLSWCGHFSPHVVLYLRSLLDPNDSNALQSISLLVSACESISQHCGTADVSLVLEFISEVNLIPYLSEEFVGCSLKIIEKLVQRLGASFSPDLSSSVEALLAKLHKSSLCFKSLSLRLLSYRVVALLAIANLDHHSEPRIESDDGLQSLVSIFLDALSDDDLRVRKWAVQVLPLILSKSSASLHGNFCEEMKRKLKYSIWDSDTFTSDGRLKAPSRIDGLEPFLSFVTAVACESQALETNAILDLILPLLLEPAVRREYIDTASFVLFRIAQAHGYTSILDYLGYHLPCLFAHVAKRKIAMMDTFILLKDLEQILERRSAEMRLQPPSTREQTIKDLVNRFKPHLSICVVFKGSEDQQKWLMEMLNEDSKDALVIENIHVLLAVAMLHNCVRNLAVSESDVTDIVLDHFASLCFHVLSFTRLHRTQWPNITITDNDNPTSRVLVALQKVFLKQSEISSLVSEIAKALHAIRCHMLTIGSALHKGHALHAVQIFFESNPSLFLHPYSIKILTKICCESLETGNVELAKAATEILLRMLDHLLPSSASAREDSIHGELKQSSRFYAKCKEYAEKKGFPSMDEHQKLHIFQEILPELLLQIREMQENPFLCFDTKALIEKLGDSLRKGIFYNHRLPGFRIYGIDDQVAPDTPQDCLIELARALHIFPKSKWKQLSKSAAQAFDAESEIRGVPATAAAAAVEPFSSTVEEAIFIITKCANESQTAELHSVLCLVLPKTPIKLDRLQLATFSLDKYAFGVFGPWQDVPYNLENGSTSDGFIFLIATLVHLSVHDNADVSKAAMETMMDLCHSFSNELKYLVSSKSTQRKFPQGTAEKEEAVGVEPCDTRQATKHCHSRNEMQHGQDLPFSQEDSALSSRIWDPMSKSYDKWICDLASLILVNLPESSHFRPCWRLARVYPRFAEWVFPKGISHFALSGGSCNNSHGEDQCKSMTCLIRSVLSHQKSSDLTRHIRVIMDVLVELYNKYIYSFKKGVGPSGSPNSGQLRSYFKEYEKPRLNWKYPYWLRLEILEISKAALLCDIPYTALRFFECTSSHKLYESGIEGQDYVLKEEFQSYIVDILQRIDEPDGIYACSQWANLKTEIALNEHESRWGQVLSEFDMAARLSDEPFNSTDMDNILSKMECHYIREKLRNLSPESSFELLRGSPPRSSNPGGEEVYISDILTGIEQSLQVGDGILFKSLCGRAENYFSYLLQGNSIESSSTQFVIGCCYIKYLAQIRNLWNWKWQQPHDKATEARDCILENVVSACSLLQEELSGCTSRVLDNTKDFLYKNQIRFFERIDTPTYALEFSRKALTSARKSNKLDLAQQYLQKLLNWKNDKDDESSTGLELELEWAKLLWARGRSKAAIHKASSLANRLRAYIQHSQDLNSNQLLCSKTLCVVGKWLSTSGVAKSSIVLEKYLTDAITCLKDPNKSSSSRSRSSCSDHRERRLSCRAHFRLAAYADKLFSNLNDMFESEEYRELVKIRNEKLKGVKSIPGERSRRNNEDLARIRREKRQFEIDSNDDERLKADWAKFLLLSVQGYCLCLQCGSNYDHEAIFRVISLWFKHHSEIQAKKDVNEMFKAVPAHKFLILTNQLVARIGASSQDSTFTRSLHNIVSRMVAYHPFHSLLQVMALRNGRSNVAKDESLTRTTAVDEIFENAQDLNPHFAEICDQICIMVDEYTKIAYMKAEASKTPDRRPSPLTLPRSAKNLTNLTLLPVITDEIQIDPLGKYLETIEDGKLQFSSLLEVEQINVGKSKPKRAVCRRGDGCLFAQLVKSGDDLREDAIMQQFFQILTHLLLKDKNAVMRSLSIRTYKVVPFSSNDGVMEFVPNTEPIGNILATAHERYQPKEYIPKTFMNKLQGQKPETQLREFLSILKRFSPVFHFVFVERYPEASEWFHRRLAYVRSVATNSMAGYILGVGDRHPFNILIDEKSAEMVHIDFGICFEQGKYLATPEQVPFRLTREIIDGMGITGTEGVFRKCSETVLRVLQSSRGALMTIIDVFLHDPLYHWTKQSTENENVNLEAKRVRLRVQQKLHGFEGGEKQTTEGQVAKLIVDASDPEKLCRMYCGWAPWL